MMRVRLAYLHGRFNVYCADKAVLCHTQGYLHKRGLNDLLGNFTACCIYALAQAHLHKPTSMTCVCMLQATSEYALYVLP